MLVEEKNDKLSEEESEESEDDSDSETTEQEPDPYTKDLEEESIEEDSEGLISGELIPKHGCLKGCLVPILIVFVVMLALGFGIHTKRNTIREWFMLRIISNTQENVLNNLPKEIDKKTIEDTFEKVKTAFKENQIDEQGMKQAIKEYLEAVKGLPSENLKKEEIDKLMTRLNEVIIAPD
jgi:hypothetical protein